jgi:sRNA-binding regulator protein Hfq
LFLNRHLGIKARMRGNFRCFIGIVASALLLAGKVTMAQTAAADDLITLAHKKFSNFKSEEEGKAFETFFAKTQDGEKADLTPELKAVTDPRDLKILTDPVYAGLWGEDRVIKAEWLEWLCTDPTASTKVTSRGIEIAGARIEGKVDLSWANIQFPLRTFKCAFTDDMILNRAKVGSLQLQSTYIQNLNADYLTAERDLSLVDGFRAAGRVWLRYATINGTLTCDSGHFINPGQIALDLEGAKIGSVFMRNGFEADGEVELYSTVINGTLDCAGGYFHNPSAVALDLEGVTSGQVLLWKNFVADGEVRLAYAISNNVVDCDNGHFINPRQIALDLEGAKIGSVFMRNGFEADGDVELYSTVINGSLECDGGKFHNPGKIALNLEAATASGEVLLWNNFEADGEVRLYSVVVNGTVDCDGSQFRNPSGVALNLDDAKIGSVLLRNGFEADGEVRLYNAVVSGSLDCAGGHFHNPSAVALNVESAKIGSIFLRYGFNAEGTVSLHGAKIAGNLECDKGRFLGDNEAQSKGTGYAIEGDEIDVDGGVYLRSGFRAVGVVWLRGAKIGGNLECSGGHFLNPGGLAFVATGANIQGSVNLNEYLDDHFEANGSLDFQGSQAGHDFILANVRSPETLILDLRSAKVKALENLANSWPRQDNLLLHGFVFDELRTEAAWDAETQINWIRLQSHDRFFSQPYEQMAAVFRTMGRQEEAVKVMIEKNKAAGPDAIARDWNVIVKDVQAGSQAKNLGYWWKALETALQGLWDLFWYNFFGPFIGYGYRPWRALLLSLIIITIGRFLFKKGYVAKILIPTDDNVSRPRLRGTYPKFNAWIYSLETFVPLVKLGVGEYWRPNANGGARLRIGKLLPVKMGGLLRLYLWFHIIAGWVLTTLWVGGFTGLLKT